MTHDDYNSGLPVPPSVGGGPLPIPYTAEEVGRTFADLLATFDFGAELHGLEIGRFNFFKRTRAKQLLTAMSIALWHIALEKSFPQNADGFFFRFHETYPSLVGDGRRAKRLRELVARYDALMTEKKDTDFTKMAETLAEDLEIHENDRRKQHLKLSLRIRAIYDLIFDKLI